MRTAKTLIRLGAQSFCWFCHVAAHIILTRWPYWAIPEQKHIGEEEGFFHHAIHRIRFLQ